MYALAVGVGRLGSQVDGRLASVRHTRTRGARAGVCFLFLLVWCRWFALTTLAVAVLRCRRLLQSAGICRQLSRVFDASQLRSPRLRILSLVDTRWRRASCFSRCLSRSHVSRVCSPPGSVSCRRSGLSGMLVILRFFARLSRHPSGKLLRQTCAGPHVRQVSVVRTTVLSFLRPLISLLAVGR